MEVLQVWEYGCPTKTQVGEERRTGTPLAGPPSHGISDVVSDHNQARHR